VSPCDELYKRAYTGRAARYNECSGKGAESGESQVGVRERLCPRG